MFVIVNIYQTFIAFTRMPMFNLHRNSTERVLNFAYSSLVPFYSLAAQKRSSGMKALKHDWLLFLFICNVEIQGSFSSALFFPHSPLLYLFSLRSWARCNRNERWCSLSLQLDWFVEDCVFFSHSSCPDIALTTQIPVGKQTHRTIRQMIIIKSRRCLQDFNKHKSSCHSEQKSALML